MRQVKIVISFMLVLGVFVPINAIESTLIDFTTYNDNIRQVMEKDQEVYEQIVAERPELDIRNGGWPDFKFEADDWNLENWRVVLNASSKTIENDKDSLTKNAPSKQYGNVLGIRLNFHPWKNAFWATVTKPFYFSPTYTDGKFVSQDDNNKDNGLAVGLLVNIGQIRSVQSWMYGLNFKYNAGIRVRNEFNQLIEFGMGSLYYEGWRRLGWHNPYYLEDVNDWTPTKNPLYPYSLPYIKFDSLAFYKPEGQDSQYFITYVKDITMDYDYAVYREDTDIDDEAIWHIISTEAINKRVSISQKMAEELLLRRNLLKLKQVSEDATANQQQQQPAGN